jgi:hypothetical protein
MGIYTSATVPEAHPDYVGKSTLYFSVFPAGNAASSGIKTFGNSDGSKFLNHGTLYP